MQTTPLDPPFHFFRDPVMLINFIGHVEFMKTGVASGLVDCGFGRLVCWLFCENQRPEVRPAHPARGATPLSTTATR